MRRSAIVTKMPPHLHDTLQTAVAMCQTRFGQELIEVRLYGSQLFGPIRFDSDVDVFVMVAGEFYSVPPKGKPWERLLWRWTRHRVRVFQKRVSISTQATAGMRCHAVVGNGDLLSHCQAHGPANLQNWARAVLNGEIVWARGM